MPRLSCGTSKPRTSPLTAPSWEFIQAAYVTAHVRIDAEIELRDIQAAYVTSHLAFLLKLHIQAAYVTAHRVVDTGMDTSYIQAAYVTAHQQPQRR